VSVVVSVKVRGNTELFRKALVDRADEFSQIGDRARPSGALHHRFGIGDGFVHIVDEWESAEQFQQFFSQPDLQAFMPQVGADLSTPPEITISEAITTPDEF
jgi:hypothetical protein